MLAPPEPTRRFALRGRWSMRAGSMSGFSPVTSRCPLHENHVRAVLALHPGEHFLPVLDLTHSVRLGRRSRDQPAMVVQLTERIPENPNQPGAPHEQRLGGTRWLKPLEQGG